MTLTQVGASVLRIAGLVAAGYLALGVLLYLARNRILFPSPRDVSPEPSRYGMPDGEKVVVTTEDGERLVGWYLGPTHGRTDAPAHRRADAQGPERFPALLWLHGNGETVGGIAPIIREFRPEGAALLVVDFRGYGESTGRATVRDVAADAEAMWRFLASRPEVDPSRIVIYGRSVGTGPAVDLAARLPAAGLILESAFTSLRAMARFHYPIFPSFLSGGGFDNLGAISRVACPVLFIHGDRDRTIPIAMSRALAARTKLPSEFYLIRGADHNSTYDVGDADYVRRVQEFVARVTGGR